LIAAHRGSIQAGRSPENELTPAQRDRQERLEDLEVEKARRAMFFWTARATLVLLSAALAIGAQAYKVVFEGEAPTDTVTRIIHGVPGAADTDPTQISK
jgi:hypothetical protein